MVSDMITFEHYSDRISAINEFLNDNGIESLEEAKAICDGYGIDVHKIVRSVQPFCFEDACWAYLIGCAAALKSKTEKASDVCRILGQGLQAFCIPGSVAYERKLGIGHGNLASAVLNEDYLCFAFLAGHESFAATDGAVGISRMANKVRKIPLRVILNGLGKDAAEIISRMNGLTYVRTAFDLSNDELEIVSETAFSNGENSKIRCYGANEAREGIAIMEMENVDISISGNATNMVKFQHVVAGAFKHIRRQENKRYFACASGGGIGRTLNSDDLAAGPASYGLTDLMARMYADATFAGSSSVPAHVEMMGFIGMGNNPMVGATVTIAVETENVISRLS